MKKFNATLQMLYVCASVFICGENRSHEIWWEKSLGRDCDWNTFAGWLGDINAPSRSAMRNHIKLMKYSSILDVPSGLCVDYFGIREEVPSIEYKGLDVTPILVERAESLGIPVTLGSIEQIPFPDSAFDVCYARHILEHLDYYELAMNELIRTAGKEVLITFFITPLDDFDKISPSIDNGCLLYHNCYNKKKLENFVISHPKVAAIFWEQVPNTSETILHVYLVE